MAESRGRATWAIASSLMALIANVNRDPKKGRSFRPGDFNPYLSRAKRAGGTRITAENINLLKTLVRGGKDDQVAER